MSSPSANIVWEHNCPDCARSFKRLEHLKRHRRSHGVSRLYACYVCPKTFARSDVLRRHINSHEATASDGALGPRKRACFECARLRERCTKGQPCSRCHTKSLKCIYPVSEAPPGTTHNTGRSPNEPEDHQTAAHLPTPETGLVQDPGVTQELRPTINGSGSNVSAVQCEPGFEYLDSFPVNWLDLDHEMDLDLTSMLGQGFSVVNDPPTAPVVERTESSLNPTAMQQSTSWDGNQAAPYTYDPKDSTPVTFVSALPPDHPTPTSISTSCASNKTHTRTPELTVGTPVRGDFYLDSIVGSRTPCTARFIKRSTKLSLEGTTPLQPLRWVSKDESRDTSLSRSTFPDTSHVFWGGNPEDPYSKQRLDLGTFHEVQAQFQRLCCDSTGIFTPFSERRFLQYQDLQLFADLYFKHFDPICPLIHSAVANVNTYWPLAVAICAIGSQYTETQDYSECVEPLHEFLRRALLTESERCPAGVQALPFEIARNLSQTRVFYSQSGRPILATVDSTSPSVPDTMEGNETGPSQEHYHDQSPEASTWRRALALETRHRLQLFRMLRQLLKATSAYTLGIDNHHMSPQDLETPVPNYALWTTTSSKEWTDCHHQRPLPSLFSAIDTIFRDKSFDSRLCEFGRLILLHGVYSQVGAMQRIHSGPLGTWTPSLREPEPEIVSTSQEACSSLGLKPVTSHQLSNWRSAGLDCVDVLHWAANGTIAAASGFENPLVMHLHFSRTLLSAPVSSIRLLATFLAFQTSGSNTSEHPVFSRQDAASAERRIIEWAQRDQCKARLAVLHCGCFLWHLRRYSRRAFYEPTAVFLATLTIWAYSLYASRAELQKQNNSPSMLSDVSDDESDTMPTFVRLDRPNDDEMVQLFVRSGAPGRMKAHITGVGDIYSAKAPSKILREGMKLLESVSTAWGRDPDRIHLLQELAGLTSGANYAASSGRG